MVKSTSINGTIYISTARDSQISNPLDYQWNPPIYLIKITEHICVALRIRVTQREHISVFVGVMS